MASNLSVDISNRILRRFFKSEISLSETLRGGLLRFEGDIIQVGSNDGVSNDPLYNLLREFKRRTILIEPIHFMAERLRALHSGSEFIHVLQLAIHPTRSEMTLFYVPEESKLLLPNQWRSWYSQLGSFSKEHIIKHNSLLTGYIRTIYVSCVTLDSVISRFSINTLALLHVDVEGADVSVLSSLSLNILKPHMILVEYKHLSFRLKLLLLCRMLWHGYEFYIFEDDILFLRSGINRI